MRPYLAVLGARFRALLQYRAAAAGGMATQLFWGLIRVMIFTAFFESTRARQPMTLQQTVTYVWLGQATLGLMPWSLDPDVKAMVRTGSVAYELTRPADLYGLWYARAVANRVAPTLLRCVPLVTLALLFFGMSLPPSAISLIAWIFVITGAIAVTSAIGALQNVFLVSMLNGEGFLRFSNALTYVLSGMLVPIPLLPRAARIIIGALPFRDIMDAPLRVYMGSISPLDAALVVLHQAVWTTVLVVTGRAMLARTLRKLVVQGG